MTQTNILTPKLMYGDEGFLDSIEYGQQYFCKCGHSLNWHTAGYFELNRRDNGVVIESPKHRFCYCPLADCKCESFSPINGDNYHD